MTLPAWAYAGGPNTIWVFLLLTLVIGSSAALVSGYSIANTWRPFWQVPLYVAALTFSVRFLHYALFNELFLPVNSTIVDFLVLFGFGTGGFLWARRRQMAQQYGWLLSPPEIEAPTKMPVN